LENLLRCDVLFVIFTKVFFFPHVTDKRLETVIDPNIAWKYLLSSNREDMIITWISAYYNRFEGSTDIITRSNGRPCTDREPSDENSEEVQIQRLFTHWDVTQSMIDSICDVCCMIRTKEIVLDHLSR
jgi:hypothetical protein